MGLDRRINQPDLEIGPGEGTSGNKRRLHLREVALSGPEVAESYDGVGAVLAGARTRLKLDLDRVAADLRIRRSFIEAIETGRFDALPGQAYTQGFVRSYAAYLKIDPEEILERLREETSARRDSGELVFPQPVAEARLPGWQLVLATVLIAALVYVGWVSSTRDNGAVERIPPVPEQLQSHAAPPSAPAVAPPPAQPIVESQPVQQSAPSLPPAAAPVAADAPPQIQAPAESPQPPAALATADPAAPAKPATAETAPPKGRVFGATDGPARIVIRANADSWVRVTEPGGAALLRRILRAGDSFNVPARSDLELAVGNAAAIDILVDGEMLPSLGGNGEVLRNIPLVPETLKQGIPKPKRQFTAKREKPAPAPETTGENSPSPEQGAQPQ